MRSLGRWLDYGCRSFGLRFWQGNSEAFFGNAGADILTIMGKQLGKAFRETWFFWVFFLCLGFMSAHEPDGSDRAARTGTFFGLGFALLAALWVLRDARRRGRMGYGFPGLVLLFWPLFGPVYLFQSRGMRAFLSMLAFLGMVILTSGIGALIGAAMHP